MGTPHVVADRFEVLGLAGAGGAASVYRAVDRTSGMTVALKVLRGEPDAQGIERFTREAQVLQDLSHPGIVRYVTHGRAGDQIYLAMEWLEGLTLTQRLAKKSLTLDESLTLVRLVADALGSAHRQGIVHRDVKPANIFLSDGEPSKVKVLDFGIARLRSATAELTKADVVIGTPGYMAPEQARGERSLDARADVFSLGCVFFRCLTGRNAFSGEDAVAVLAKILLEEAPRVSSLRPDVPPAVDALVADMLAKQPKHRPTDANAVIAAIDELAMERLHESLVSNEPISLTTDERRMTCILLSRAPDDGGGEGHDTLRAAVASQGGHLDVLADGSLLVTVVSGGTPTDSAARGARCALAMRSLVPTLPMVLVAGEAEFRGQVAMGPVIDRGAALLGSVDARSDVRLDEVVAGFLDGRFEVKKEGASLSLMGERDAPRARTFLGRPSRCVGRERDLALLDGIYQECVEDSVARIVLVTGPAGIGKSRVLEECLRKVHDGEREVEVWIGRGDAMSARSPFGMIADPIRQAAGIRSGDTPDQRRDKLRTRVARVIPDENVERVTCFLAEIIATPFSDTDSVELRAARADPALMGDQMRRAWEDWLDAETARHPVVLVLEDLHWGDLPSVKCVDTVARHLANRPLLVLALARPDVYEWFPNLWKERSLTELRLSRLADRAAQRLVREALGGDASEVTIERVVARADGNPFFLEELVRAVADGKGDELPSTVLAMVQARLAALPAELRRFLRAASVFGRVFSSRGVSALLGGEDSPARQHEWLTELVAKDVLARPGEASFQGELAFHHALIHDAAYSMLTDADRTLGHRLAAEWLERGGEADPIVLAEHFERGDELPRAIGWYWRAAEQALGGNDHASAIQRVEKAIACGAEGEEEGAVRLIESEARRWRGENELSKKAALAAMDLLPRGSPGWCDAASELGHVSGSLGDTEQLVALATELEDVEPLGSSSQLVNALARVARPLFWAGKHTLGSRVLARAGVLEERVAGLQPTTLASLYMARGVEARLLGDPSECVRMNQLAVGESERAGDLRGGCVERGNLGYAYLEIGAYAEAEEALTLALATASRLGLPLVAATARQNLGLAVARRGAFEEAIALEQASFDTFEAQGDVRRGGCSLLYLALIEVAAGRLDDAERTARRAVGMLGFMEPLRCNALSVLAQVELDRGDPRRALHTATEAHALFERLGSIDEGESRVRLVYARALHASGDEVMGEAAMTVALACLLARAAKIQDPARRERFLGAIPENAQTLELAREWGVEATRVDLGSRATT